MNCVIGEDTMIIHKVVRSILYVFTMIVIMSCGSSTPTRYFIIDLHDVDTVTSQKSEYNIPEFCAIRQIDSGTMYQEDKIIFRDNQNEIKHWNYQRWIAPPSVLLTSTLKQGLIDAKVFRGVFDFPSTVTTRYLMDGKILAFEELDNGDNWSVKVKFEIYLLDNLTRTVVWQKIYENLVSVKKKSIENVVSSFNEATQLCIGEMIKDLSSGFADVSYTTE